jgi:hypothetical protein
MISLEIKFEDLNSSGLLLPSNRKLNINFEWQLRCVSVLKKKFIPQKYCTIFEDLLEITQVLNSAETRYGLKILHGQVSVTAGK